MKNEEREKETKPEEKKKKWKKRNVIAKRCKNKLQAKEGESLLCGLELSLLCCSSASSANSAAALCISAKQSTG